MSESLRDLLLKSGLAKSVPKAPRNPPRPAKAKAKPARHADEGDIDLARAYAMRAQTEARDRVRAQRDAEQKAQAKKEARRRLQALLDGKAQNKADAEEMRHFEYHGKIRRVHVDAEQLRALNAGELGVVQFAGRYLVVAADIARQAVEIDTSALALLVDPDAQASDEDGIPNDLVW